MHLERAVIRAGHTVNSPSASSNDLPVAIVGIGCRFPGGVTGPASLWRLLDAGVDAVSRIPENRYALGNFYDPHSAAVRSNITPWGGFLDGIENFDAEFFGISPREAERLDPQQRLLLETSWEALEDAGQDANQLRGARIGVFVGLWLSDFEARLFADPENVDFYMTTGSGRYAASGRISYALNLRGPSLTLDTACSSSLVAVHLAAQSIRSGESEMAIAGGANIILQPHITLAYSQSRMMAADGRCKFGDARGDGYVRSEGAGVVVLKSIDRALADGDRIYAVIRGSAVNNDGSGGGSLGTPSRSGQEELLRSAYRAAGCSAAKVGYVEAHGTGTRAGDPIELGALGAVLSEGRAPGTKALVGSIKSNIGHTEGAAGVAGLIKTALALHHGRIPASLHCVEPNPAIDWTSAPYEVARGSTPWAGDQRLAGVSAFGITGTNAHVVLEQAPAEADASKAAVPHDDRELPMVLALSARSPAALRDATIRYAELLDSTDIESLNDVCWSAATRRTALTHRAAFVSTSREDIVDQLRQFASEAVSAIPETKPRIVFVCPGQGAQWRGMARELYWQDAIFRAAMHRCDVAARSWVDVSLVEHLLESTETPDDDRIDVVQPLLVALAIAYAEFWQSLGVEPDALVGHSMGEVAAAHLAGVLDLDQAMRIVCRRSALMRRTSGQGAMAMVDLSMRDAQTRLRGREQLLTVAVGNSPRASVISGAPAALAEVLLELDGEQIFNRLIKVDVASHSPQMDALANELRAELADIQPGLARTRLYSTVTAAPVYGSELDSAYWGDNLRQPVRFGDTIDLLANDGMSVFVELGPHPILVSAIEQTAQACECAILAVGSARRGEADGIAWRTAAVRLWAAGVPIRWDRVMKPGRFLTVPTYAWQRERHWIEVAQPRSGALFSAGFAEDGPRHPLLQRRFDPARGRVALWETQLGGDQLRIYRDHCVGNEPVFPAAGFIELVLAGARNARGDRDWTLADLEFHSLFNLPEGASPALQLRIEWADESRGRFEVHGKREQDSETSWVLHASGTVRWSAVGEVSPTPRVPLAVSGTRRLDTDALQRLFSDADLHYGPRFQLIEYLDIDEMAAAGRLSAAFAAPPTAPNEPETSTEASGYFAYPPLLDAALQALLGCLLENRPPTTLTWVPVSIGEVQLFDRLEAGRPYDVLVALSEDRKAGDVIVKDDSGRVLASFSQVRFAPLGISPVASIENMLHELKWEPVNLGVTKPTPIDSAVLVLARSTDSAQPLIESLEARNVPFQLLLVTESPEENWHAALRESLVSLEAQSGSKRIAIVHLLGLSATPPTAGLKWIESAWQSGPASIVACVKAMASGGSVPRVWLVTRRACATGSDSSPLSIGGSPVWGMGRVLMNERPDLDVTLIDLDDGSVAQLALLLENPPAQRQLALRGGRWLALRLVPSDPMQARSDMQATLKPTDNYRAVLCGPSSPNHLQWQPAARAELKPDEVEIEVEAVGLNFMNLMSVLGIYPGYEGGRGPLGIECAGIVSQVGCDVTAVAPGDAVVAIGHSCLARYAVTHASLVMLRPAGLTAPDAAGFSIAFATAWYGLHHLARLTKGERVLIHSAAGGVGLAALQIARHLGAQIIATAGTEEKRVYLRSLGIEHVFDSRNTVFAADVHRVTGGGGVDVVLNSLSGDAIAAGLETLGTFGRFVELGKRDIYGYSTLALQPFRKNLSFFAVDLDAMMRQRPHQLGEVLRKVLDGFAQGQFTLLPTRRFRADAMAEAFQDLVPSTHIGKHVIDLVPPPERIATVAGERCAIRPDGSYLITGGLGALGLQAARWLSRRGAGQIIVVGRSAPGIEAQTALQMIRFEGTRITSEICDVCNEEEVFSLLESIRGNGLPLRGIMHAAGILDDGVLTELTNARLGAVRDPKAVGAWILDQLTADDELDFMVFFSSVASVFGTRGQGGYAAANAFLDSLAHDRAARGRRSLSINLGPVAGVGLAAALAERRDNLAHVGFDGIDAQEAIDAIDALLASGATQAICTRFRPAKWHTATRRDGMVGLLGVGAAKAEPSASPALLGRRLDAVPAGPPRRAVMDAALREEAAKVLRSSPSRIPADRPLQALGLDSLMALELRSRLERCTGLSLPATLALNYPTLRALGNYLGSRLGIPLDVAGNARPPAAGAGLSATDNAELELLLADLGALDYEEAQRLLASEEEQ